MKLITTALVAGLVPAAAIAQSPPFLTNSTLSVSPFVQSPAVKWAETTGAGVSRLLAPATIRSSFTAFLQTPKRRSMRLRTLETT